MMTSTHIGSVPVPASKLPRVGTTVFTVMSALAAEHKAINLGQGFPDFNCDVRLIGAVDKAMRSGLNQYPPLAGVPGLLNAISDKIATLYGHRYDPQTEITVTAGATQAILTAVLALVQRGNEVIVLEPAYDSYVPAIALAGGTPVFVPMTPPVHEGTNYTIDWDRVRAAITPATRAILLNSPHNPSGMILRPADLEALQAIVEHTGVVVISDEVYEHMAYDGARHESVARYPALARRSVVISSFGKTYHVTGWKIGYAAAPAPLMTEFRKVHQFNVFTVNTPMQYALAAYMRDPEPYLALPAFYQAKRDLFRNGLRDTRLKLLPCDGTYFQLVRYDHLSTLPEEEFCKWLVSEIGVAAIPLSAFYDQPKQSGLVRFCFAKKEETLKAALERLTRL